MSATRSAGNLILPHPPRPESVPPPPAVPVSPHYLIAPTFRRVAGFVKEGRMP